MFLKKRFYLHCICQWLSFSFKDISIISLFYIAIAIVFYRWLLLYFILFKSLNKREIGKYIYIYIYINKRPKKAIISLRELKTSSFIRQASPAQKTLSFIIHSLSKTQKAIVWQRSSRRRRSKEEMAAMAALQSSVATLSLSSSNSFFGQRLSLPSLSFPQVRFYLLYI